MKKQGKFRKFITNPRFFDSSERLVPMSSNIKNINPYLKYFFLFTIRNFSVIMFKRREVKTTEQVIANFLKQLRKTFGQSANEVVEKLKGYHIEFSAKHYIVTQAD
ncbi:hypothetical protein D5274_02915 [bacterium 1XD42-94]|nr:hypothetical protein [bacterium 1XD42-76]NBK04138.1 hypothetical protein [bacterium 1XD42-94]